ncbi:uncharacterized protein LOC131145035 [Malania oleifera]|uniref:uncharacterized protein LOC131145035 n=1 Tax=Malania oleifera TaxID=397392 RepID=UPI0025AE8163|nr:uncharacterized protein LOC131145035 [Malania oleifera]
MAKRGGLLDKLRNRRWRWRFARGGLFRWKGLSFQLRFVDDVLFKIASVFEAIVLVSGLCLFFLVCGCHF